MQSKTILALLAIVGMIGTTRSIFISLYDAETGKYLREEYIDTDSTNRQAADKILNSSILEYIDKNELLLPCIEGLTAKIDFGRWRGRGREWEEEYYCRFQDDYLRLSDEKFDEDTKSITVSRIKKNKIKKNTIK